MCKIIIHILYLLVTHHIESISNVKFDAPVVELFVSAVFPLELHVDHGAIVWVIEAVATLKRPFRHTPVLVKLPANSADHYLKIFLI